MMTMKLMASGIVVLYNGKIGIIGTNGNSILPTEYPEIRDNIIDESNKKEIKGDWSWIGMSKTDSYIGTAKTIHLIHLILKQ